MAFISPIRTDLSGNARQTGSMQSLGKDDFLQLLVTKMQHQDPMNPMSDEDFIAQLAQFSTLEQMNNIAEGIATSNEWDFLQMQSLNNTMATGLIGKDVKADYRGTYIDAGQPANISFTLDKVAAEVTFNIKDQYGNIVRTLTESDLDTGSNTITWDATDSLGNLVDDGYYSIEATATTESGASFKPQLSLVGRVESIIYRNGAAYLRVSGVEIPLGEVNAIGEPGVFDTADNDDSNDDDNNDSEG